VTQETETKTKTETTVPTWSELANPYGTCCLCGGSGHGVRAVTGQHVCHACWSQIERRPGRVAGNLIREGLALMRKDER
jgi:hypothetical protein